MTSLDGAMMIKSFYRKIDMEFIYYSGSDCFLAFIYYLRKMSHPRDDRDLIGPAMIAVLSL